MNDVDLWQTETLLLMVAGITVPLAIAACLFAYWRERRNKKASKPLDSVRL